MIKRYMCVAVLLCLIFSDTKLMSQPGTNRYLAINETFALTQIPVDNRYLIIAFIPRYFLLFIDNRNDTVKIPNSSHSYVKATTQDGVKVLVNAQDVSTDTFDKLIGQHQYIFNAEYDIFKDQERDPVDPDVWRVGPGEAFFTKTPLADPIIKLEGTRLGGTIKIIGYLDRTKLDELENNGTVTRSDKLHPKYTIDKTEITTFSTDPGQIKNAGDRIMLPPNCEIEQLLLQRTNIGEVVGTAPQLEARLNTNLGALGKKISFFGYKVFDNTNNTGSNNSFMYIVMVEYECTTDLLRNVPVRINRVEAFGPQDTWRLNYQDFPSLDEMKNIINSPYLFSINNYPQYLHLIERLSQRIGDRTLAGYFLCEFNRSLPSRERPKFKYSY
jgi:hypothetical protein